MIPASFNAIRGITARGSWPGSDSRHDDPCPLVTLRGYPRWQPEPEGAESREVRPPDQRQLTGFHFHDLRHADNTLAGGPVPALRELMERMGHSTSRAELSRNAFSRDSSGLEIDRSFSAPNIEWHRDLAVRDQPIAADLLEAQSDPDPHSARLRSVAQRATEPTEEVPECHISAHSERQVANLISHITKERERIRPVLQFRLYPYMLQGRLDVEGDDVRCVKSLQTLEVLGSESFNYLADLLPNRSFVYLALRRNRYPIPPFGVESWLLTNTTTQHPGMSRPQAPALTSESFGFTSRPSSATTRATASRARSPRRANAGRSNQEHPWLIVCHRCYLHC